MKVEVSGLTRSGKYAGQPQAYSRLSPARKTLELRKPPSRHPSRVLSPVTTEVREIGLTLHEILAIADMMQEAYGSGEMRVLRQRLSLLMSKTTVLESALSNITESSTLETKPTATIGKVFDIVALLHDVSETARQIVGDKPVTVMDVSCPDPVVIHSDPVKIRQIMSGLLSNAAKFTKRGRIAVILSKDDGVIKVTIADTGRGMAPEQIGTALGLSDRGCDTATSVIAASETGLRTVKALVEKLDGSIRISSKLGEGTIVEVSLPLEQPE